jgi:hypothetical protein
MTYLIQAFAHSNSKEVVSETTTDDKNISDMIIAAYKAKGWRAIRTARQED